MARGLLRDAVAALPGGVLRGFDLLAALAAQDADEAAHRVLLPAGGSGDFGEGRALGATLATDRISEGQSSVAEPFL